MIQRIKAKITGRVQGVGFRPTIFRYANFMGLLGGVKNTSAGVEVEVQGENAIVERFFMKIKESPPPQARIDHITFEELPVTNMPPFSINQSLPSAEPSLVFPPDLALCDQCRVEIETPSNRRYRYEFTNCTNCGPRFTIIRDLPYDRAFTSMSVFSQCQECESEYSDPMDRRFDAQPNACPNCGPKLVLVDASGNVQNGDPLLESARLLAAGAIVAIKGLGGYHLACDALKPEVIAQLRTRKNRPHKPLAVMFASIDQIESNCQVTENIRRELSLPSLPIVICRRLPASLLPDLLSPDTPDVGVMLPYTPLHHLLLAEISPLVMTSGNFSEEPIVRDETELKRILGPVADYALCHNRPILRTCDDSVIKTSDFGNVVIRRARGYVPDVCQLPLDGPSILACGGDLKNTFCLTRGRQAWVSQHLGNISDYASFLAYQHQVTDWKSLLEINPRYLAYDMHPDYHSSRWAQTLGQTGLPVQHHHAHIAAVMAEHGLQEKVIGVAWDGSGYGLDQTLWGGEFLIASYHGFLRAGHLKPLPLPGGEQAILHPARMAVSYLFDLLGSDWGTQVHNSLPSLTSYEKEHLTALLQSAYPFPVTSSAGRLFDAVAALLGFDHTLTYEGQAAVRLQALAEQSEKSLYSFEISQNGKSRILDFKPMLHELLRDLKTHDDRARMAMRFHRTLAGAISRMCVILAAEHHLDRVVLSGGVFQNDLLLGLVRTELVQNGLQVFHPRLFPANDGGLSLGQAVIALAAIANPATTHPQRTVPCA
ncbi:MAG: carbamoyltransferase HypF [candidate division FCPU426 bacterium]